MRRYLAALMFLSLLVCAPAGATNFFYWDTDSQTVNFVYGKGSVTCTNWATPALIDTSTKAKGTASLRYTMPSNSDAGHKGCHPENGIGFNYPFDARSGKSIYYRWWMKIGTTFGCNGTFNYTKSSRDFISGTKIFTGFVHCDWIGWENCISCTTGENMRLNVDLSPNDGCDNAGLPGGPYACTNWHEYIMRLKLPNGSATDGFTQLYIDGNLVRTATGIGFNSSATPFNEAWGWMAAAYPQYSSAGNAFLWVDDISIDDVWNSSIGPQPNPPTLLPVQ
jgi:hypothetical protein